MLIAHKKKLMQGLVMILSFAALLCVMMLPLFRDAEGRRLNSLQYADSVFNQLSKGSSYFIPEVIEAIKSVDGAVIEARVRMRPPSLMQAAKAELERAGAACQISGAELAFHGDLGAILRAAALDSELLYNNDGAAASARYGGAQPLALSAAWWHLLNPCVKQLQKAGRIDDAKIVELVVKKAIEPANNFYGVQKANVSDNILLVCGMLAFYVLYAIWYGFAIYHLFEGFGLIGPRQARENVGESEI